MSLPTALETEAFELLRMDLWRYLDAAEHHVMKIGALESEEDIDITMDLIPELVDVLRAVLAGCKPPDGPYEAVETMYRMMRDPGHQFGKLVRKYGFD